MMIINPIGAMKRQLEKVNWKLTLLVPAGAFGLLFFQTGLDMTGEIGLFAIGLSLIGLLYGGIGVLGVAYICALVAMGKKIAR